MKRYGPMMRLFLRQIIALVASIAVLAILNPSLSVRNVERQ
jgi:hypothetical protein